MRRIPLILGGIALLALGFAYVYAPYLPRLAQERYPQPRWPVAGYFKDLIGAAKAVVVSSDQSPWNAWSDELFSQSGGGAILVSRQGTTVLAHYGPDSNPSTQYNSYSMAKSLIGVMVLKAVSDGVIDDLDDPVGRYLDGFVDENLRSVSLRDFLQMRSGILADGGPSKSVSGGAEKDIEEVRLNPFGPMVRLHMSGLPAVAKTLEVQAKLRGQYNYQNVNTAILGAVLEAVYELPLETLVSEKLWLPAGATTAHWRQYDAGAPVTPYCCIYARAADWLQIGRFLITNGSVEVPFLRPDLWRDYFGHNDVTETPPYYGLHVYHDVFDRKTENLRGRFTYMYGLNGQVLYLMPELDLVIVRFGVQPQLLHSTAYAAWRAIDANDNGDLVESTVRSSD